MKDDRFTVKSWTGRPRSGYLSIASTLAVTGFASKVHEFVGIAVGAA